MEQQREARDYDFYCAVLLDPGGTWGVESGSFRVDGIFNDAGQAHILDRQNILRCVLPLATVSR